MSKESLEQFMQQGGSNDELKLTIENQLDNDGNISIDSLIAIGAKIGFVFTDEDLKTCVELDDAELDGISGGWNTNDPGRWTGKHGSHHGDVSWGIRIVSADGKITQYRDVSNSIAGSNDIL